MLGRVKSNMSLLPQYFQKLVESCPDIIIALDKQRPLFFTTTVPDKISVFRRKRSWEKTSWSLSQSRRSASRDGRCGPMKPKAKEG